MSIRGQVALITGAGKGIGRETAIRLASEGVHVGLLARTSSDLKAVSDVITGSYDVRVSTVVADVANRGDVEAAISKVRDDLGPIDILVNNAGTAQFGLISEMDPEVWERMIQVNLLGTYYVTRAVLTDMVSRHTGAIINVSSTAGQRGSATTSAYSASKFGVMGFTESLMQEARKYNIRVTALTPSTVNTELAANAGLHVGDDMLQPEDMADLILSVLQLPSRVFINQAGIWTTNPK